MRTFYCTRFYCPDTRSVLVLNKIKNSEVHKIANAFEKYSNLTYAVHHLTFPLSSSFLTEMQIHVNVSSPYSFLSATTEQARTHGNVTNSRLPADNITRILSPFHHHYPTVYTGLYAQPMYCSYTTYSFHTYFNNIIPLTCKSPNCLSNFLHLTVCEYL